MPSEKARALGHQPRFQSYGNGVVPPIPSLFKAVQKQVEELLVGGNKLVCTDRMKSTIEFTFEGISAKQLASFLEEALQLGRSLEPTVETGNKYGVDDKMFHSINSEIIMASVANTPMYKSLSGENQRRAVDLLEVVFLNPELRNRNCLHPGLLDSCVIGNLLNFVKQMFQFPFACHATDGNEILSLCLYSYRQLWEKKQRSRVPGNGKRAVALYIQGSTADSKAREEEFSNLRKCCGRVGLTLQLEESLVDMVYMSEDSSDNTSNVAVVMCGFNHPDMDTIAAFCTRRKLGHHVHVLDKDFRTIFATNPQAAVHFQLPSGLKSISVEDGVFRSGYAVYRDVRLRDLHLDVSYGWQTAYMSPNEGGSGASTPLFTDLCTICLGWGAMVEIATCEVSKPKRTIVYTRLDGELPQPRSFAHNTKQEYSKVLSWAKASISRPLGPGGGLARSRLEAELLCFQQQFIGGSKMNGLEVISTGGGTRSINLAFESVINLYQNWNAKFEVRNSKMVQVRNEKKMKVLTGNPHLAVERAERRFQFQLVRLVKDGALSPKLLREKIQDSQVAAVYAQTLSYTDGITDPLEDIVAIIEEENQRRMKKRPILPLVTLINDCCLAFSVLLHNKDLRVLDMAFDSRLITPILLTIDAHKHLGTDKGISTVIGTNGTLSSLTHHAKVGAQPLQEDLVRAISSMKLVGVDGYVEKYTALGNATEKVVEGLRSHGMTIVHSRWRAKGSTVIAVEDPSGVMIKKLKKRGHSVATLFSLCPAKPERCQTGWQLSLTPYALRTVKLGNSEPVPAIDVFLKDAIASWKEIKTNKTLKFLQDIFRENSFIACIYGGNLDPFLFPSLSATGSLKMTLVETLIRRYFTAQLDCGVVQSRRRKSPLKDLVPRTVGFGTILLLVYLWWKGKLRRLFNT